MTHNGKTRESGHASAALDNELVAGRSNVDRCLGSADQATLAWASWHALELLALSLALLDSQAVGIVLNNTLEEALATGALANVLNADMDALADDAVADSLGDLDTNSARGHIPDITSAAMVKLVWHTLLLRSIADNIDNIANLEDGQEAGQVRSAMMAELALEEVAGAGAVTERVRHV